MLVIQVGCWLVVHSSSTDSCSLPIPLGVWKNSVRKFGSDGTDGSDGDEDDGDGSESEESDDDLEFDDDSGSEDGDMIDAEGLAEEADDGTCSRTCSPCRASTPSRWR